MIRFTFKILLFFLVIILSCSGRTIDGEYQYCDVNIRFNMDRNTSIQFYDSTGARTWKWCNDSLDYIYAYFHVNSSAQDLVKIHSIEILNGGNEKSAEGWELGHVDDNEIVKKLEGSWIRLRDCETELSEWMLYGNYKDSHTPYIYDRPDTSASKTQFDPRAGWTDYKIRMLQVRGTWFKVELTLEKEKKLGWMPSYNLCSHPHTTCN